MSQTLRAIEGQVRYFTREDLVVLSTEPGLGTANRVYRQLFSSFPWSESNFRIVLNETTVADQEIYSFEYDTTSTLKYSDIDTVEIQSNSFDSSVFGELVFGVDSFSTVTVEGTWKRISPPPSEYDWNLASREDSAAVPKYYRRLSFDRNYIVAADYGTGTNRWHDRDATGTWTQTTSSHVGLPVRKYAATAVDGSGATTQTAYDAIAFRPYPSTADQRIRVTGSLEPTAMTGLDSTTAFISDFPDDILARLIAADWLFHESERDKAQEQLAIAGNMLKTIWKNETITEEHLRGLVNASLKTTDS